MTSQLFIVRRHTGRIEEIQAEIIEEDFDLIGLGLMDLQWREFVRELTERRGYAEVREQIIREKVYVLQVETWKSMEHYS